MHIGNAKNARTATVKRNNLYYLFAATLLAAAMVTAAGSARGESVLVSAQGWVGAAQAAIETTGLLD
jgi:hypothetical protein